MHNHQPTGLMWAFITGKTSALWLLDNWLDLWYWQGECTSYLDLQMFQVYLYWSYKLFNEWKYRIASFYNDSQGLLKLL